MRENELGETRDDCCFGCVVVGWVHVIKVGGLRVEEESASVWLRAAERSVLPASPHEKIGTLDDEMEGGEEVRWR